MALGGALGFAAAGVARAADWPEKSITWIVPFPAGGPTDSFARSLAAGAAKRLGQTIVIDNRSGAGGTVGATVAAHAAPDGYTMLVGYTGFSYVPLIYPKAGFDLARDFAPIAAIDRVQEVLAINPGRLDAPTLRQFLDIARRKPASIDIASGGLGTVPHLAIEMLEKRASVKIASRALPWRSAGAAGSAGRAGGGDVRLGRLARRLCKDGKATGVGRCRATARGVAARCADHAGGGSHRLSCRLMGRPVRAEADA